MGEGRPAVPRHLQRPAAGQSGQRYRGGVHPRQDPRDRQGPGHGGEAVRYRPPLRRQAPADRHRLFRDLQPRQCHAGGCAGGPDRADHAATDSDARRREYTLDIIVFATGFDAMTGPLLRMNITGRDGADAQRRHGGTGRAPIWGCKSPDFPNLFTITGPGSPSVLCNMPVAIEQHVEWITDCIAHMRAHAASSGSRRRQRRWSNG